MFNFDRFNNTFEGFNPNMNPDSAGTFVRVRMNTEADRDFYARLNGSRKKDAPRFPLAGIRKVTEYTGYASNAGYSTIIKNKIAKHGGDPDSWDAIHASGMSHKSGTEMVNDNDPEKRYIRLFIFRNANVKSEYKYHEVTVDRNDPRLAGYKKVKKSYDPKWVDSITDADGKTFDREAFLADYHSMKTICVKEENLREVKAGDFHFTRP